MKVLYGLFMLTLGFLAVAAGLLLPLLALSSLLGSHVAVTTLASALYFVLAVFPMLLVFYPLEKLFYSLFAGLAKLPKTHLAVTLAAALAISLPEGLAFSYLSTLFPGIELSFVGGTLYALALAAALEILVHLLPEPAPASS